MPLVFFFISHGPAVRLTLFLSVKLQMLEEAILKTQKNPRIVSLDDTPYGNKTNFTDILNLLVFHLLSL